MVQVEYHCPHCPTLKRRLLSDRQLVQHYSATHSEKLTFVTASRRKIVRVGAIVDYHCPFKKCTYSTTEKTLVEHYLQSHRHVSDRYYVCGVCYGVFKDWEIAKSVHRHHGQAISPIEVTPRLLPVTDEDAEDMEDHGVFECRKCGEMSYSQDVFAEHMKDHVTEDSVVTSPPTKMYACGNCGDEFSSKDILKEHNSIEHPEDPCIVAEKEDQPLHTVRSSPKKLGCPSKQKTDSEILETCGYLIEPFVGVGLYHVDKDDDLHSCLQNSGAVSVHHPGIQKHFQLEGLYTHELQIQGHTEMEPQNMIETLPAVENAEKAPPEDNDDDEFAEYDQMFERADLSPADDESFDCVSGSAFNTVISTQSKSPLTHSPQVNTSQPQECQVSSSTNIDKEKTPKVKTKTYIGTAASAHQMIRKARNETRTYEEIVTAVKGGQRLPWDIDIKPYIRSKKMKGVCVFCTVSFPSRGAAYNHICRQHLILPFICRICNEEFAFENEARRHDKRVHGVQCLAHIAQDTTANAVSIGSDDSEERKEGDSGSENSEIFNGNLGSDFFQEKELRKKKTKNFQKPIAIYEKAHPNKKQPTPIIASVSGLVSKPIVPQISQQCVMSPISAAAVVSNEQKTVVMMSRPNLQKSLIVKPRTVSPVAIRPKGVASSAQQILRPGGYQLVSAKTSNSQEPIMFKIVVPPTTPGGVANTVIVTPSPGNIQKLVSFPMPATSQQNFVNVHQPAHLQGAGFQQIV